MKWQPMDSAPRDGTPILVYESHKYRPFIAAWVYVGRFTNSPKMWVGHELGPMQHEYLAGWMPIPEPPEPGFDP